MLCKIMPQLPFQETAPSAALEVKLPAQRIFGFGIRLVVDQSPWAAKGGGKCLPLPVLGHPASQVCRVADVKAVIRFRMQDVNVKHENLCCNSLYPRPREAKPFARPAAWGAALYAVGALAGVSRGGRTVD